jgi:hypothetical protein
VEYYRYFWRLLEAAQHPLRLYNRLHLPVAGFALPELPLLTTLSLLVVVGEVLVVEVGVVLVVI